MNLIARAILANDVEAVLAAAHSPVHNYVIPGLTSSLLDTTSKPGSTVRVFTCSRDHQEVITPHSHRFNFECIVMRGQVTNRIWKREAGGDTYQTVVLEYSGEIGKHIKRKREVQEWTYHDEVYVQGQTYSMSADQVHSIWFSRGAVVLFFEGPQVQNHSIAIEPYINGEMIDTMTVQPWMFRKGVDGNDHTNCNEVLRGQGKGYPRTCKLCGITGPCKYEHTIGRDKHQP